VDAGFLLVILLCLFPGGEVCQVKVCQVNGKVGVGFMLGY